MTKYNSKLLFKLKNLFFKRTNSKMQIKIQSLLSALYTALSPSQCQMMIFSISFTINLKVFTQIASL